MLSFTSSPHIRLYAALSVLLFSVTSLLYLFQDTLPDTTYFKTAYPETALQHDPPPEFPPFGALVVAAQNTTDLSWTEYAKEDWHVLEYDVDTPNNQDPMLRFPMSKGRESMVYLSFIIDHYDKLPWAIVFVHGHREAWHQEDEILSLTRSLNRIALARHGYISLRCDWYPSCPAEMRPVHGDSAIWGPDVFKKGTEAAIAGNWRFLFPNDPLPETIASPCCAQFAVTRQAVMKRPKADYLRLRDWLMSSLLEDYLSGRVIEKIWAFLFTGQAVYCPPPELCACEWFGRCGTSNWTTPPEGLAAIDEWP